MSTSATRMQRMGAGSRCAPRCLLVCLVAVFVWLTSASAFARPHKIRPGETKQQFANELINEAVNTNMLFAYQDFISTGRFLERRRDQPDKRYQTFRLPGEVSFGEKNDTIRPFVLGSFALLRVTSGAAPVDGKGEDDRAETNLFALTAGSGAYVRVYDGLFLVPSVSLSFAHLHNSYDFNNPYSQQYLQPEDDEFYNWGLNLFTYTPAMRLMYQRAIGPGTFTYTVGYAALLNDSISSTSSNINISSNSGLLTNRVDYLEPLGVSVSSNEVSIRPFFQWSNISGKAASGLNFVNMFEVGADFLADLKESILYFSQMYVGASYVSADNFEGFHIGFGGHF